MKKITLWLFALFTCWQISAQTGIVVIGTSDGTPNTATGNPSPLQDFYKTQRMQVLYTASELSAAGLVAGNITEIGWVATALNTSTLQENYKISMKSTTSTALTATFESGATVVYGPTNYTPSATGNVMFTLTTPFVWDGTSNVLIELCAGLASGGYTENVSCANFTTAGVQTVYYISDTATNPCAQATGTTITTKPLLVLNGVLASCLPASGLTAANITANGVETSWFDASATGAVGYEYAITTSATPPTSGTQTTDTFYLQPTGLTPQTVYFLHVRVQCAGSTYSSWSTISFTTACSTVSAFSENFDSVTTPNLPSCWGKIISGTGVSAFATVGTATTNVSAPNGVNLYNDGSAATANIILVSPLLDNLSAGTHRLKFKARNNSATQDLQIGVLTNPADASTFTLVQAVDINATFQEYVVNFDVFTGPGSAIAIKRLSTSTYTNVYLDDIVWEVLPTCPDQTGLTAANITANGVETSWFDTGAIGYEYAITTSATPPTSGTQTLDTFYIQSTGLTPQTVYYLHVRSECAGSTYGNWATISFTTSCVPVVALPWTEGFEGLALGNNIFPSCWGYSNTTSVWNIETTPVANTGVNSLGRTYNTDGWAFTPTFTLTAGTSYRFSYYMRTVDAVVGYNVTVGVGTGQNSAAMTTTLGTPLTGFQNPTWTKYNFEFTPGSTGDYSFGVRAVAPTFAPNGINFDDFRVELSPTCPDQTGLTAANITANGVETSWFDTGAIGYQYAITTSATPPASGTQTVDTFYIQSTGLTPQTVYYLHVRSECAGSTYGNWATIYFTTSCVPVVALPWTEGFEGLALGNNIFPSCWGYSNTTSDWNIETTPVANTGVNSLGRTYNTDGWAFTPTFTLTAGTSYRFSYYMRTVDAVVGYNVTVGVGTGQNSAAMTTTLGTPLTGFQNPTWTKYNFEFTPGSTGDYSFGVRAVAPTFAPNGINFDDFRVELSPTCPDQTGLTAANITANGVETSWFDTGAIGYQYAITTSATPPASGTQTVDTFYIQTTGLTPQTVYYLHVRSECAGSTYGNWATISFTTSCVPVVALPWTEGFEGLALGNNIFPTCWGYFNTASDWNIETTPVANSGANSLGRTWSTDGWAFTPTFTLTAATSYTFSYYMRTVDAVVGYNVTVGVGTGQNSAAMTTTLGTPLTGFQNPTWTLYNFEFTPSTTGDYSFGVHAVAPTFAPNGINFDDFKVELSALSSDSFDKSSFVAYPNPVKDVLNLSYKTEISNVRIINLLGQEVLNTKTNTNDVQVNMSALTAGAYIVNITVEDTVHTIKVIKE
jgi:hypothetical protein